MSFKSLFFTDETSVNEEKVVQKLNPSQVVFDNKFPDTVLKTDIIGGKIVNTSQSINPNNPSCEPHLTKILALYEKGFDDLNQPGYDFYEFFKAINQGGADNPLTYVMGLTMAKAMDGNVSKETLLSQSDFYITEINKVHTKNQEQGKSKNDEILQLKLNEQTNLTNDLESINKEIDRLGKEKIKKENELSMINNTYEPQLTEIACKLMANDVAKDTILGKLTKVINGIKTNI